MTARAAPRASAADAISTSSITAAIWCADTGARRRAGAASNETRNCLRVGSMPGWAAIDTPGEPFRTAKSPVSPAASASTSSSSAAAASGTPVASPRRATPSSRRLAVTDALPRSRKQTAVIVVPSAIPRSSSAAVSLAPNRFSARGAATAVDNHGPGCNAAPSSSATMPASTIVMPEPPQSSGTSIPVTPRPARPRHTDSSVPVGSSSSGRTWSETEAFSARKCRVVSRSAACSSLSSRFIFAAAPVPVGR